MKRLMVPAVVLAWLVGLNAAVRAESPCCESESRHCAVHADAHYNNELLDILQETHSVDAFVVTLNLLVETDVEPRNAIPLIIRSAERLGIFGDTLQQEDEKKPSALVIEVIGALKKRMKGAVEIQGAAVGAMVGGAVGASTVPQALECTPVKQPDTDFRTATIPPIREGAADACQDMPDDAEVLRALSKPPVASSAEEICRDGVEIVKERIVDRVDEVRFYPMVGLAQLHHSHWKCTVYSSERVDGSLPIAYHAKRLRAEVVYIDKDHLHLCPPPDKTAPKCEVPGFLCPPYLPISFEHY